MKFCTFFILLLLLNPSFGRATEEYSEEEIRELTRDLKAAVIELKEFLEIEEAQENMELLQGNLEDFDERNLLQNRRPTKPAFSPWG